MSSHFIHMNLIKSHEQYFTKTLETNIIADDKTKSKLGILVNNPKKSLLKIFKNIKDIKIYLYNKLN